MPTQERVAIFMQTRIDCDIAGFAVLNSLQKVTERHFWFRVTPDRTFFITVRSCEINSCYSWNTKLLEIGTYEKFLEDLGEKFNSPPRSPRNFSYVPIPGS